MSRVEYRWNDTDNRIPELVVGKSRLNATLLLKKSYIDIHGI